MKKIILSFLFGFFIFFLIQNFSYAQDKAKEPVIVDGDEVQYLQDKKIVSAEGNVKASYQDMELFCDKAVFYTEKKIIHAQGNVKIISEEGTFKADNMEYDINTKKAALIAPEMFNAGPWFGAGEKGKKYADKSYLLNNSYITTCDLEKPHYKLQAKQIKVYLGDKVVAKNVIFKVKDIPLFYFPRYTHSMKDNKPHVRIVPGHSSDWGHYVLTAWRYALPSLGSGRIHLDYREFKGWGEGIDNTYDLKKLGSGKLDFYYIHEKDKVPPNNIPSETEKDRYRVKLRHSTTFADNNSLRMEVHKMRDANVIKDYFYDEYKEENQPSSYLSLIHTAENYNLSLLFRERLNDFFTVTEKSPEIGFNTRKLNLKDSGIFFNNTTIFSNFNKEIGNSKTDNDTVRFDTVNKFSYPFKAFKFLSLEPWVSSRQTYYSKDSSGQENFIRGIFSNGIDLSTKLYKIYDVESNFLSLNLNKLRHIVTPTIEYSYTHDPTVSTNRLTNFDSIDEITKKNLLTFGIENRLQTKREKDGKMSTYDLGYFRTTIDYDILPHSQNRWKNLNGDLEFTPYDWLRIESDFKYEPQLDDFESFNFDTILKRNNYEVGLGHRYQRGTSGLFTTQFKYYINKGKDWKKQWILDTYARYEDETQKVEEFQVKLTKDLHCWLVDFIYDFQNDDDTENGNNHTFFMVFRLKAFPEMLFKIFETSYEEPKPTENSF